MNLLFDYLRQLFAFDASNPLLFTQLQFWVWFAFVFLVFSAFAGRPAMRNAYLFFISLLFYYKTSGWFVGLLIAVTCSDYLLARLIGRFRDKGHDTKARLLLCLSVVIDLSILCYFKYTYFFADVVGQLFGLHWEVTNVAAQAGNWLTGSSLWSIDRIILPVGISFYTFQLISYTADVYKGLIRPVRNLLDFGFYVSFFPQLVAGPIVKASTFIPQLYKPYRLSRRQFGFAVFWILNGLAKKLILSDYLAVNFVDRVFANPLLFTGFENLSALVSYSLQIYADFSGYTDIAIGLSLMMGFYLPANFNSPYQAHSAQNFWKRWHISLSSWLQNYLYYTLGGNRQISWLPFRRWRQPQQRKAWFGHINSMLTMLLGGLWHGASYNFVVWGGLNGIGIAVSKMWNESKWWMKALALALTYGLLVYLMVCHPMPLWNVLMFFFVLVPLLDWCHGGKVLLTFMFITFTWLFFRAGSNLDPATSNQVSWGNAMAMIQQIGSAWNVSPWPIVATYWKVYTLLFIGLAVHWLPRNWKRRYRLGFARLPLPLMALLAALVIIVLYQFVTAEMQPFIYFQF